MVPNQPLYTKIMLTAKIIDFISQEEIPVTIINPPCDIKLKPTTFSPKTFYIGEPSMSFPHFNIETLKNPGATFGDCTKANFIFQYRVNGKIAGIPNSWLGINYIEIQNEYILLYNHAVLDTGTYEIITEIFNQEK
jgi:hypothetical protein